MRYWRDRDMTALLGSALQQRQRNRDRQRHVIGMVKSGGLGSNPETDTTYTTHVRRQMAKIPVAEKEC